MLLLHRPAKKTIVLANSDTKKVSIIVDIANNPLLRAIGLMGRIKPLEPNSGMFFVFDRPGQHSFWMFGTFIPLEAIFIDDVGRVVDIVEMQPGGLNPFACLSYSPKNPAKYVLEVNKGFCRKNRLKVGQALYLNALLSSK